MTDPTFIALPDADLTYFMRRLAVAQRAQISPVLQFELARLPIDDDALEDAADAFGATRPQGWGLGGLMESWLSREVPEEYVGDLKALQENLVAQGFAAPGTMPSGVWDSSWQGALRRMEADSRSEFYSGRHPGAAPIEAGVRLVTNTLPSRVWQGIVGTAKGLVLQAPETAESLGAAGGAAAGATIGATVGSVVPGVGTAVAAGVGAAIGGVAGFFADLIGGDEEEVDQSAFERIADALSPWDEYRGEGGAQRFLEDLGWVMSASSLVAGAGLAARGVAAGVGLATTAAEQTGSTALVAALAKPVAGAEPGWFSRIAVWASKPALGAERVEKLVDWVRWNGLRAQAGRPIVQTVQGFYTGLSAGQTGARLVAGLGTGTADIDADIAAMESRLSDSDLSSTDRTVIERELSSLRAEKTASMTTIQRAIEETSPLPSYVDLLGFLVFPTQFFPIRAGQVTGAIGKALAWTSEAGQVKRLGDAAVRVGGGTDLMPYAHVVQEEAARAGESIGLRDAVARAKQMLGRDEFEAALSNTWYRRNFGVDIFAAEKVADLGLRGAELEGAWKKARASIIADLTRPPEIRPVPQLPGSLVVDDSGELIRVFHGTTNEFAGFDPARVDPDALYGPGLYFTENPEVASGYARTLNTALEELDPADRSTLGMHLRGVIREKGHVALTEPEINRALGTITDYENSGKAVYLAMLEQLPYGVQLSRTINELGLMPSTFAPNVRMAFLDIRKPFDVESIPGMTAGSKIARAASEALAHRGVAAEDIAVRVDHIEALSRIGGNRVYEELVGAFGGDKAAVNAVLREAGFDGITHTGGKISGGVEHRVWIAFDTDQVHAAFRSAFISDDLVGRSGSSRSPSTTPSASRPGCSTGGARTASVSTSTRNGSRLA